MRWWRAAAVAVQAFGELEQLAEALREAPGVPDGARRHDARCPLSNGCAAGQIRAAADL
jgi:hypothetical protein